MCCKSRVCLKIHPYLSLRVYTTMTRLQVRNSPKSYFLKLHVSLWAEAPVRAHFRTPDIIFFFSIKMLFKWHRNIKVMKTIHSTLHLDLWRTDESWWRFLVVESLRQIIWSNFCQDNFIVSFHIPHSRTKQIFLLYDWICGG